MRSFVQIVFFSAACLLGASNAFGADAEASRWEIDVEHSSVGFRIQHIAGYVTGGFRGFTGEVEYTPEASENSQFYMLIDSASVDTRVAKRDDHLRSPEFLDVQRAPKIIFSSKTVFRESDAMLVVIGDLTIRDVTMEVRVPVQVLGVKDHPFTEQMPNTKVLGLSARFSINRRDFQVGSEKWTQMGVMGEQIELLVDMELLQRR